MSDQKYMKGSIREKLIRRLRASTLKGFAFERELLRQFTSPQRGSVIKELNLLISEGYACRLGMGRQGDPHRIVLNSTWPFNKCPLCGHVEFPAETKTAESVVMGY